MRNAKILSTGMSVPDRVVKNEYFNTLLGEDVDTWLRENVHIYERRWCSENESTADLCQHAAQQILNRANVDAADIDLIIVATDTPEYISPATASVLQHRLGAVNAGTFDINAACAGFVTALDMGTKYIQADPQYRNVLVIGAYAMSKYLNLTDKKTVTLFADGAGGVLLKSVEGSRSGMLSSILSAKGQYHDYMGIYAGGTKQPMTVERVEAKEHLLQFVHKFPKELNPDQWTSMVRQMIKSSNLQINDIDHFFITQININSIWETMDRLGVNREKAHTIMHHYGYTGSACIPMALNDAMEKGQIKEGELVCFIGSGGGLAFASAIFRI